MSEADIVIVGSGAVGSLMAARLGEAGRKVVVLEGGPPRALSDLVSSTVWARRLKWNGPPVRSLGANPIAYNFEAGWGQGGAALHHYAVWLRLHESDFRLASGWGVGRDWPISYDDLRPYYDDVQREVGLSGDAGQEIWRPPGEAYPMPALPVFRQGELLSAGFSRSGLRVAPMPMAINSIEYNGRPPCIQDGWCDAGCPTGALANPITIFHTRMREHGVETRYRAAVTRLIINDRTRRVDAVEYCDERGERRTVNTKLVILAAFSVQTPRILLNSATSRFSTGAANSSGLVGRGITAHGAVAIYGMFDEDTQNYLGRTGGQLISQESYLKDDDRQFKLSKTWRLGPAMKLADLGGIAAARPDLIGNALNTFMSKAATGLVSMSVLSDAIASLENRVELTEERDAYGAPCARLSHEFDGAAQSALQQSVAEGLAIMRETGAKDVWAGAPRTEHIMGGVVMGRDAASSVTNGFGQCHDIENLFVAGPSLFPSAGAVNPTFTASALAARSAAYIASEWSGLERAS